jgi:flavin reductase (DIM6/NTAB) family NADH-FMN oxidoreductase RutF
MTTDAPSVLSHFWSPLTAVGSHGERGPNAQVCVSVFGASVVPERPRLLVNLSKTNYTTELVQAAGTLALTLLAEQQLSLLEPLGLRSGRDGGKLAGCPYELTVAGDPWFPDGVGLLTCEVIESYDLGDSLGFLVAVREQRALDARVPLSWQHARTLLGSDFMQRWADKSAREREAALASMHWRS